MEINGKEIAQSIYAELKENVGELIMRGRTPHLVVILVGDNPSSIAYVNQKRKWAEFIGADVIIEEYPEKTTQDFLEKRIEDLNQNASVHAILVQIPLPRHLDADKLTPMVSPRKDIDGFHPESPFTPPLASAVITVLEEIKKREGESKDIFSWLTSKRIVLLGKGKAGGMPVHNLLQKQGVEHTVIDSKSENREEEMREADIIISAVGKKQVVKADAIKDGVILIGVGINLDEDKKLFGDYEVADIKEKASYYTPTPGGVGPVNVASLLKNLIKAADSSI